jgi:hypothetical protein
MTLISKILYGWHNFRMNYHHLLVESCLDEELKRKLLKKYEYHKSRVVQVEKIEMETSVCFRVPSSKAPSSQKR